MQETKNIIKEKLNDSNETELYDHVLNHAEVKLVASMHNLYKHVKNMTMRTSIKYLTTV